MSYLGNSPGVAYAKTIKDTFSGDDSSRSFTLSVSASANSIEVLVENVQQEPGVAYTVSDTTLTFDSAPPSGSGNIYVIHRDPAVQRTTLNDSSITNAMLGFLVVENDNIADNSVTNAKLANDSVEFAEITLTSFNGVIQSTGGGGMYIAADSDIYLTTRDFTGTKADFITGGPVKLYNNNTLRFYTSDSGATVVGAITADSIYGDGSSLTGIYPTQTGNAGRYLTTNGTVVSWDSVEALPTQTGNGGKYLTTDGTIASWDSVDALPLQTSNGGKYLTTDGTLASWDSISEVPVQTGQNGKYLTTDGTNASWDSIGPDNDVFWVNSQTLTRSYTLALGNSAISAGPVTLDSGVTVTLDSGTRWVIV